MSNFRLIPVDFIVERAKAFKTAAEALPLRNLLSDWFVSQHHEADGLPVLNEIDEHFPKARFVEMYGNAEQAPVVLPGCVLGRFRTNALASKTLVAVICEIHRRMTIPVGESRRAKRREDVRQDNWTWPHVMRVMIKRGIIAEKTNKATFGAMIEQILGDKVKKNSVRRANYGDYSIVDTYDFDLSDEDKEIIKEITSMFLPLFKTEN
jgi:hypothetical protein